MKIIKIIIDEDIPLIHLLDNINFEVITTSKDDVFAMTRREIIETKEEKNV